MAKTTQIEEKTVKQVKLSVKKITIYFLLVTFHSVYPQGVHARGWEGGREATRGKQGPKM